MKSSASMASGVKLLLFHQLARAAATVRPLEMSCSSWALSMGSGAGQSGCGDVVMSHREYLSF